MTLRDSLKTLLKESPTFDSLVPDIGNITYATSLAYNDDKKNIVKNFINYVSSELKLKKIPKLLFISERVGGMTTGAYDPNENKIFVLAQGRLLADVLRTVAHELVHAMQREYNKFKPGEQIQDAGGSIEDEANSKAGELLKTFVRDHKMDMIYSI